MPRVSIGIPVYNSERYIRQSVGSLLAQTYGDFELVITDNASTDGTEAICREYVAKDKRVRYFRNERNLGGPANFRRVFSLCSGEFHKWSNADDSWDPTMIEKCVAVLDREPDVVVCYPMTRFINKDGDFFEDYDDNLHLYEDSPVARFIRAIEETTLCHVYQGVIRRAAMMRTGLMGDEMSSDVRFFAELSLYGKFFVLPEHLFFRRFHDASPSSDRSNWEAQRKFYDPERKGFFRLHSWRRYLHLLASVTGAPIDMKEKVKLYRYLGRKMRKQRRILLKELRGDIIRPSA
jgi:glycosyltransferase involved in cell wall biosynthesis